MTDTSTPKPFAKLKRADLEAAPIWVWIGDPGDAEGDEQYDESFVQATAHATIPQLDFAQFIVGCNVELKGGTTMPGIAEVTVAGGEVAVLLHSVFLLDRQLHVPGVETNRLLARYTRKIENFPVGWRLSVCVGNESQVRTGQIKGGDMADVVQAGLDILLALKALRK